MILLGDGLTIILYYSNINFLVFSVARYENDNFKSKKTAKKGSLVKLKELRNSDYWKLEDF